MKQYNKEQVFFDLWVHLIFQSDIALNLYLHFATELNIKTGEKKKDMFI